MGVLRFLTCGSVDDGKSTLIGRLLYDTKLIFEDQLAALKRDSVKHGTQGEHIDFARPGVTGRIHVGKDRIKLDVQLGLLLGMLKPTIEREIEAQLDKLLV